MPITRRDVSRALAAATGASYMPRAFAQAWPTQPVRIIVTQAAGGTPDIVCRMMADRLSRALGQPFIVENKPGAANVIGAQAVARATPDGHTLLWATAASLITNVFTLKALPYAPQRDFVTISRIAKGPFFVVASPTFPVNDMPGLIALAKQKPGALSFATDGPRNFSGLIAAWLNKNAGLDIPTVPYAAMPTGIQDVIGGRVQMAIIAIPSATPMMKGGLLKAIAVSSAQVAPGYESIAPIAQTLPGFDFYGWFALSAPAAVPTPILNRLNTEVGKILDDPSFAKPLAELGFYSFGAHSRSDAESAVRNEFETWRKLVTELGIEPE